LDESGAKEFHGSARRLQSSAMDFKNTSVNMGASFGPAEFGFKVTDRDRVKSMLSIAREAT
jgi:copper homeostasis protein